MLKWGGKKSRLSNAVFHKDYAAQNEIKSINDIQSSKAEKKKQECNPMQQLMCAKEKN